MSRRVSGGGEWGAVHGLAPPDDEQLHIVVEGGGQGKNWTGKGQVEGGLSRMVVGFPWAKRREVPRLEGEGKGR